MKIYKSKTLLSISVKLANGKGKHLMFDAMADGRGMLRVTNPVLMEAIERHPQYGKWFVLWRNTEPEEKKEEKENAQPVAVRTEEGNAGEQQEAGQVDEQPVDARTEEVKSFDSFDDAREWVAETFGIAKKRLMSKVAVINLAAENGVTIEIN